MYALDTLAAVNSREELKSYVEEHPPVALLNLDCIRHAPDYAQVNMNLLEKVTGLSLIETFFVDSSGFGRDDEPALTYPVFVRKIEALMKKHEPYPLFAVLSGVGQFQVYYSVFIRKGKPCSSR
jgi:hypothetical protein